MNTAFGGGRDDTRTPEIRTAGPASTLRASPHSGGRAILGGTAFSWRLDQGGNVAEPHAAYAMAAGGGKLVAMAEAMAYLLMGTESGVRLSGVHRDPSQTVYWGKDAAIFMKEVREWLLS